MYAIVACKGNALPCYIYLAEYMQQNACWEANVGLLDEKIPKTLLTSKVHCRIHKTLQFFCTMNYMNPERTSFTFVLSSSVCLAYVFHVVPCIQVSALKCVYISNNRCATCPADFITAKSRNDEAPSG